MISEILCTFADDPSVDSSSAFCDDMHLVGVLFIDRCFFIEYLAIFVKSTKKKKTAGKNNANEQNDSCGTD